MDKDAAQRRENEFLSCTGDAAAIYRFDAGELADRCEPLERARLSGKSPIASGYDLISAGPIAQGADILAILNEYRASGFAKSGDVVAFKQADVVTCWYVDYLAYSKLPGLLNHSLAASEMSVESNYNQIDGIINNEAPRPAILESGDDALYLVGGTAYLHIQTSEDDRSYTRDDCYTTYSYTLYDKETHCQLDSGRMEIVEDVRDDPRQCLHMAAENILECRTLFGGASMEPVSMDILDTLRDASMKEIPAAEGRTSVLDTLRRCQEEAGKSQRGTASPVPSRDPER